MSIKRMDDGWHSACPVYLQRLFAPYSWQQSLLIERKSTNGGES
jgi:hypothetical protein